MTDSRSREIMTEVRDKIKVLFLCTGNSCRSQIAEGWARHLLSDTVEVASAGTDPAGLSSRAVKVMAEVGVDISQQTSKHVDDFRGTDFDYVITLCDGARESCPVFPGHAELIHVPFEDPGLLQGSEEEIMAAFQKTRDDIKAFVETLPKKLKKRRR